MDYIILEDFLNPSELRELVQEYDDCLRKEQWHVYDNPLEKKKAFDNISHLPSVQALIQRAGTLGFVETLKNHFHISEEIELDSDMYGAGFHNHPPGGYLAVHLDYEINPENYKKRYLNLILYLNDDWDEAYHGATELWNADHTVCEKLVYPIYNNALVFRTDGNSWHGLSTPIACPRETSRKTVALYYVSKATHTITDANRTKAHFHHPQYAHLCEIRKHRRLTPEDF